MIIGTFAYCGSGQDTLADSICAHKNYMKYSLGDVFRNIARSRGLSQSREVLQSIRIEYDQKYGRSYVPRHIVEMVNGVNQNCKNVNDIIITGIRTVEEYDIFNRELGMHLLFVYANKDVRYSRMLRRADEKDATSIESLKHSMSMEERLFDYKELEILADYRFDFSMRLEAFKKSEEAIVDSIIRHMADLGES